MSHQTENLEKGSIKLVKIRFLNLKLLFFSLHSKGNIESKNELPSKKNGLFMDEALTKTSKQH